MNREEFHAQLRISPLENLTIEGGGAKGVAEAGAVLELAEQGRLDGIRRVAGTSAGAILAVPLALGVKPDRLVDLAASIPPLRDGLKIGVPGRLWSSWGAWKGDRLAAWVRDIVGELTGTPDLTFSGLQFGVESRQARELKILAYDLSRGRVSLLDAVRTPHLELWRAARMSASIPGFFSIVDWDGRKWWDGGIAMNFPITEYDGPSGPNPHTVGIRVGPRSEWEGLRHGTPIAFRRGYVPFIRALLLGLSTVRERQHLEWWDWDRTAFASSDVETAKGTVSVGTVDFDLARELRGELVANGRRGMREHLEWRFGT